MGAVCIEKHFTLDKNMVGPDQQASLEPDELKNGYVIRKIELALGDYKKPSRELSNIKIVRKSIVAKNKKGEFLNLNNITVKRPGNGISQ